jgi:hypothetical protein
MSMTFEGSCHCAAIQFRVTIPRDQREVLDCDCSVCLKRGFLHLVVPESAFQLVTGQDRIITYTFGTGATKHMFCSVCGIHAFYKPRSQPDQWDVNARCLNAQMSYWTIKPMISAATIT